MTIEELKKRRKELYHDLVANTRLYCRARKLYLSLKERHDTLEKRYRETDYELALLDGRRQVLEPSQRKAEKQSVVIDLQSLSEEQKLELAELLGIMGDEEEE